MESDIFLQHINCFPQSYLIVPFYVEQTEKNERVWKKYIDNCAKEDGTKWTMSKLVAEDQAVFKDSSYFEYIQQFFRAFRGDPESNSLQGEYHVLELRDGSEFSRKVQDEGYIDTKLVYQSEHDANKGEEFGFSIQCRPGSIDAIRLLYYPLARTGILIVPIKPNEIAFDKYSEFLGNIRFTRVKGIKKESGSEDSYSLNDIFDSLMSEFKGHYTRANEDCVQHLSFILINNETVNDSFSGILSDITRCRTHRDIRNNEACKTLRLFHNLMIGASHEGTTVFYALKIAARGTEERKRQRKDYALEQRERIVLYFIIALQRYTLLRVINELAKGIKTSNGLLTKVRKLISPQSNSRLKKLRKELGVVCETKVNNSFTSISDVPEANDYYRFCCNALEIEKLYEEIDGKVNMLNSYLTQESNVSKERADWHLSIILATLTVMSAGNDGINLIDRINSLGDYRWLYYAGVILAIIFVTYLFVTIIRTRR